jgi:LCP family protein required for cell wall assembly
MPTPGLLAAAVVAPLLALTACTSGGAPAPQPGGTASASPAGPAVDVTGVPAELADVVRAVYGGTEVPASATAAQALAGRRAAGGDVRATGSTGALRGAQVAVVTSGDDVTLAVADPGAGWRVVGGWWPSLGVDAASVGPVPRLVAVVGSDARPGQDPAGARGDSLHLVGLDGSGAGGVVGIPRDSWVPVASGGQGRVNSALALGGPAAQLATLEQVSGLDLEGQVVTGFAGFTALVDALGGVPVQLDRPMQDPFADLDLPAGQQTLDGADALALSRTRKILPRGDLDRQLNGGRVLLAAGAAARLAGPGGLPAMLQAAEPHLVTDLGAEQLLTLAAAVLRADPARVPNVVVPARGGTVGGASVVFLEPGARDVFADLADGALTP